MLFKRRKTFIVVADGAQARIFEKKSRNRPLELRHEMRSAASRTPTREQGTGKPGRGHGPRSGHGASGGQSVAGGGKSSGRHEFSDPVDWHDAAKSDFLGELTDKIRSYARAEAFDDLILVAPARALGELRSRFDGDLARRLKGELEKDLTNLPAHELPERLKEARRI